MLCPIWGQEGICRHRYLNRSSPRRKPILRSMGHSTVSWTQAIAGRRRRNRRPRQSIPARFHRVPGVVERASRNLRSRPDRWRRHRRSRGRGPGRDSRQRRRITDRSRPGQPGLRHRRPHPLRGCRPRRQRRPCSPRRDLRWPAEEEISEAARLELARAVPRYARRPHFTGGRTGRRSSSTAADEDWVKDVIAEVPQCSTSVVTVGGLECVVHRRRNPSRTQSLWPTCSPSSTRATGPRPTPGSSARCTGRPNAFPPTNGGTSGKLSGSARLPPTAGWGSDNGFDSSRATRLRRPPS